MDNQIMIEKYGRKFPEGTPIWAMHASCYRWSDSIADRKFHFMEMVNAIWGSHNTAAQFIWHPWAETMLDGCLENQYVALVGSGSCGKSAFMAIWMIGNYISDPFNTLCVCTSTSIEAAKVGRIWGSVQKYWGSAADDYGFSQFGSMVSHPTTMVYTIINGRRHDDRGIILVPSEKGGAKSGKMRGFKVGEQDANARPRRGRMFLCADEMTEVDPKVLTTAMNNLVTNPGFHMIGAANPGSFFDPFGEFAKPKLGWDSITTEDDFWPTANGGIALHFDATRSPNYLAKEDIWPLQSWKLVADKIENTDVNSPEFWRDFHGFWPPAGSTTTIYTEADLLMYGAYDQEVEWNTHIPLVRFAGIDPAFTDGGDRCAVSLLDIGRDIRGNWQVFVAKNLAIYLDSTNKKMPFNEAIATKVAALLRDEGVSFDHVAIDTSGGGEAWGTIFTMVTGANDWIRVNFSGAATIRPISMTDLTPSNQKYANRVTEIWYAGKEFLRNKQLKGIKGDLSIEMVSRKYATVRSGNTGTRLVVETKREMKKRMSGRSPDLADSTFIALDAVRNYLPIRIGDAPLPGKKSTWRQKMSKFDVTAKSNNHYLPSTY